MIKKPKNPKLAPSPLDLIRKSDGVVGGDARIRDLRIPVWQIIHAQMLGASDALLLENYPLLTEEDLNAAKEYYRENPREILQGIWLNETAAKVRPHQKPSPAMLFNARILGISDEDIMQAFDPPLTQQDLQEAWEYLRTHKKVRKSADYALVTQTA